MSATKKRKITLGVICLPSALTGNVGCGHRWTQQFRQTLGAYPFGPFETVPCPRCGGEVALAAGLAPLRKAA